MGGGGEEKERVSVSQRADVVVVKLPSLRESACEDVLSSPLYVKVTIVERRFSSSGLNTSPLVLPPSPPLSLPLSPSPWPWMTQSA